MSYSNKRWRDRPEPEPVYYPYEPPKPDPKLGERIREAIKKMERKLGYVENK